MPDLFWVVVTCFATWRITSIINQEKIFEPVRKLLGEKERELENGIIVTEYTTFLAELVGCFWCLSVWVGIVCTVVLLTYPHLLLPFFLSSMAIIIHKLPSRY